MDDTNSNQECKLDLSGSTWGRVVDASEHGSEIQIS